MIFVFCRALFHKALFRHSASRVPVSDTLSNIISQVINRFSNQFSHETPILISDSARAILNRDFAAHGIVYQGRIYLFSDRLNNTANVAATLWHEILH
jgi:hypothetical protein